MSLAASTSLSLPSACKTSTKGYIHDELQRPGWTTWAIIGGLAAIVWLFFDQWEKRSFVLTNVAGLLLVASLIGEAFSYVSNINAPDSYRTSGFEFTNRTFGGSRVLMIVIAARWALTIFIAWKLSVSIWLLPTLLTYTVGGLFVVAMVTGLGMSFLRIPVPLQTKQGFEGIFIIVAGIVATVGYLGHLFTFPNIVSVSDFRIAGLVIAFYFLLVTLVRSTGSVPMLSLLVATRRELVLGKIDLDTAIRQTDIALTGLQVSEVLQQEVGASLKLLETLNSELYNASSKLEVRGRLWYDTGGKLSERQKTIDESLKQSIVTHLDRGRRLLDKDIPDSLTSLQFRLRLLKTLSSDSQYAVGEVLEKVDKAVNEARVRTEQLRQKAISFLNAAGEHESAKKLLSETKAK